MTDQRFWNIRRSTTLTLVVTWVGLVLGIACIPALIPILRVTEISDALPDTDSVVRYASPLYVCLGFGIVALVILLRLLGDIRRSEVFTLANVRRLRLISYCGFAIAGAGIVGAFVAIPRPFFVFLAIIAGFLGLLMRVIKNVIDAARLLKEDADFTI